MKKRPEPATNPDSEITPLAAAAVAAVPVPAVVQIVPWGLVSSSNGDFAVDDESAREVVAAFAAHGCDLPIDYEHQTLGGNYAAPTGQAPAAGWINRLEARPGQGIFAHVTWTDPAVEQLTARQYRYLSPVAIVRKSDRKLVGLHSVALTNKPAIVGMTPVVNRADQAAAESIERLRGQLAIGEACTTQELLVAASHRLGQLEQDIRSRHAERRVADAMHQGRVTSAQREWAVQLCLRDERLFDEWLACCPTVVVPGRIAAADSGTLGEHGVAATARAEFRAHPELASLTSEDAYVADARRCSGRL